MPKIRLPDGTVKPFEGPVTVAELAASIGPGLAKAALAGKVDGKVVDTSYAIDNDADVSIVTERDAEGLDVIRHSTAHLLAYAVKELFPDAQVTIGPVIEDGFYYDFAFKRPFTPEDLEAIERKMSELAKKNEPVTRSLTTPSTISNRSASITRRRSSRRFHRTSRSRCTPKESSSTSAAVRTCLQRGGSRCSS